nr:Tox-REase-5 domain-containing protein [Pannonibacter phragmitetus]
MSDAQRAYQQKITGAPAGTAYNVPDPNVSSGRTSFDGYNPQTNALIDARCWTCWRNNSWSLFNQSVVDQAFRQQLIAQQTGRIVEWHVPDQAAASRVQNAFATAPQSQRIDPNVVRIVVTPSIGTKSMQDALVFSAAWKSKSMTAQEVADVMRDFLVGLERVAPWEPPFDVSGKSKRQAHMPIAADLSDFDEVLFQALDDKEVRFFSESEPEAMRIRHDSRTVYGMRAEFSDYPRKKNKRTSVTINIGMGSSDGSCNSGVNIRVPFYTPYTEENGVWAMSEEFEQPEAIFEYLVDFFEPCFCSVYSSAFVLDVTEWGIDINSPIGWRSYVRSPKVVEALAADSRVSPYRKGLLIKIGDTPLVFKDSQAREAALSSALEIRDKLRLAGATDWMAA